VPRGAVFPPARDSHYDHKINIISDPNVHLARNPPLPSTIAVASTDRGGRRAGRLALRDLKFFYGLEKFESLSSSEFVPL
jgi:hypothetical protein